MNWRTPYLKPVEKGCHSNVCFLGAPGLCADVVVAKDPPGGEQQREARASRLDKIGGAAMLTIPVGPTLAALREVLGKWAQVSSVLGNPAQDCARRRHRRDAGSHRARPGSG